MPPERVVVVVEVAVVVGVSAAVVGVAVVVGVTGVVDVAAVVVTFVVVDDEDVGAAEVDDAPVVVDSWTLVVVGSAGALVVT